MKIRLEKEKVVSYKYVVFNGLEPETKREVPLKCCFVQLTGQDIGLHCYLKTIVKTIVVVSHEDTSPSEKRAQSTPVAVLNVLKHSRVFQSEIKADEFLTNGRRQRDSFLFVFRV